MTFTKYKRPNKNSDEVENLKKEIEQLRQTHEQEKKALLETIEKLKGTADEYQALKNSFISNISHEMRTPLNAILGFSELAQLEQVSLEDMREYMKIIKKSSEQLLETIKDVIYLAILDASEVEPEYDNLSLKGIFQDLEEYYTFFNKKMFGTTVKLHFAGPEGDDIFFRGDFSKLQQIFRKLIDNGLKFTERGYVETGFELPEKGKITFYVKDTGIGIPKDKISTIFEPFRTVDESHSRQFGGSGLGLSIVQRLVRLLNGRIEVESRLGIGTTVRFTMDHVAVNNQEQLTIE